MQNVAGASGISHKSLSPNHPNNSHRQNQPSQPPGLKLSRTFPVYPMKRNHQSVLRVQLLNIGGQPLTQNVYGTSWHNIKRRHQSRIFPAYLLKRNHQSVLRVQLLNIGGQPLTQNVYGTSWQALDLRQSNPRGSSISLLHRHNLLNTPSHQGRPSQPPRPKTPRHQQST